MVAKRKKLIMSFLKALENASNPWVDSILNVDLLSLGSGMLEGEDMLLPVLSGTLDDIALEPDISHSNLKEVAAEFQHPKHWSKEEDDLLAQLSEKFRQNWSIITNYFPYKNPSSVVKRWMLKHDPNVKRSRWTPEEDRLILDWYTKHGGNWKMMSKRLKGRLPDCIKNRFYGTIKKKLTKEQKEAIHMHKVIASKKSRSFRDDDLVFDADDDVDTEINDFSIQERIQNMEPKEKSKKVNDLYKKMAAIEAFISKTKREIKHMDTTTNN